MKKIVLIIAVFVINIFAFIPAKSYMIVDVDCVGNSMVSVCSTTFTIYGHWDWNYDFTDRICNWDSYHTICTKTWQLITIDFGFEFSSGSQGGSNVGTLSLSPGSFVEYHHCLDGCGDTTIYPDGTNYTLPEGFVIEILECSENPELVGTVIDLSGLTTNSSGQLNFTF